jgi:hypothetical protein
MDKSRKKKSDGDGRAKEMDVLKHSMTASFTLSLLQTHSTLYYPGQGFTSICMGYNCTAWQAEPGNQLISSGNLTSHANAAILGDCNFV